MLNHYDSKRLEKSVLAPCASFSEKAKRVLGEEEDETRTAFQRDCHRVYHSKSFRRLQGKRQVLPIGMNDHIRTRLTHTLEVTQIARSLARTNRLNEDLAEAIALAHDLGHTPFGHAGEEALDEFLQKEGLSFEHNEHSIRVVTEIEKRSEKYAGLNLTLETLDGLDKHRTFFGKEYYVTKPQTHLEGQIVNLADRIAYNAHDTEDALENGFITLGEIAKTEMGEIIGAEMGEGFTQKPFMREVARAIVHVCALDLSQELSKKVEEETTREEIQQRAVMTAVFSERIKNGLKSLEDLLWEKYYKNTKVKEETLRGKRIVKALAEFYWEKPESLPEEKEGEKRSVAERIRDYVAGMTDDMAERLFQEFNLN